MEPPLPPLAPAAAAAATRRRRRKLKKEELAVLLSVVATAVVIVQRFMTDNHLLLLPSQTMALEASVKATTLAISKLQMMFSLAQAVSLVESQEKNHGDQHDHQHHGHDQQQQQRKAPKNHRQDAKSKAWFEDFMASVTEDAEWRQAFRMSRGVFLTLVEILRPALQRQDTNMKDAIPAEWKLAAALHRLGHGATFKAVARKFGMGTSSCCKAFYDVCKALQDKLNHLFDFPSSPEGLNPIIERFSAQGMPNCCGAIGCTQILVEKPQAATSGLSSSSSAAPPPAMDYYEQNGVYSVVMQAVVDATGRFLDISVGWGGSMSPGTILPRTRLFARVESQELLHGPPVELFNRVLIPEYIIGDHSYPLLPWLITPYLGLGSTQAQLFFNGVHEYARGAVTRAFGMLKAQWQLLTMRQRVESMDLLPLVVAAACILQNFLINSGEPMPDVPEVVPREPCVLAERNEYAESIRDAIAAHVSAVARMRLDLQ